MEFLDGAKRAGDGLGDGRRNHITAADSIGSDPKQSFRPLEVHRSKLPSGNYVYVMRPDDDALVTT